MTGNLAMKHDDVKATVDAYRSGVVTLKAVALALAIYRRQRPKAGPLTAADVIEWTGAGRSQAYAAAQAVNLYLSAVPIDASTSPGFPESRIPGIPDSRTESPGFPDKTAPPLSTPCIEGLRESSSSPPACEDDEPFILPTREVGGMPGPPGARSPEADRLRAKFAGHGIAPGKVRENYGEIAAGLCDHYAAEWVEIALTCHLVLWGTTPGQPKLSQTLRQWEMAGEVHRNYLAAYRPAPAADAPPRATGTAGRPSRVHRDVLKALENL